MRLILPLIAALCAAPATAQVNLTGTASVIDGDTIEIRSQRIRLYGIDAPESSQICQRGPERWRCGAEAARFLSDHINRRTVACQWRDTDRYGRIVAVCAVGGNDLGAVMVRQGMAMAYLQYGGRIYSGQENAARRERRGIWASTFTAPWDWRRGVR